MAHHDIAVMLDAANNVVVVPNSQRAHSTHSVSWLCVQGALRIIFPGPESPLKSGALIVSAASGTPTIKEKIRKPSKKRFKYTAEVTPALGGPFSVDPDLVVEDGGGGPKAKKKASPPKKKKKAAKKK